MTTRKPPRLKLLKPRLLATLPPRLGAATREEKEAQRFRDRDESQEFRRWYKTARWQRLREEVLLRDAYICQQTGAVLVGKHPAPNSPVVDHIQRHGGDEALFWDPMNLQTVSKGWHDRTKQSLESAERRRDLCL